MSDSENLESGPSSRTQKVALSKLYLDPNNYRFIDQAEYRKVSTAQLTDATIQRRTTHFLLGKSQENVQDLIASFRQNGWLEIDRVLVRPLDKRGGYLVIEGNRRIATLKHLERQFADSAIDLGELSPNIFSKVPVTRYGDADRAHYLMMMGLQHLAGKKRWPPFNQAILLRDMLEEKKDPDEVSNALGLNRRFLNLTLRTLTLCDWYRESEYGDQFRTKMFSLFQEVIKNLPLRNWLGLTFFRTNPNTLKCKEQANLEQLFSWLSEEPDDEEGEQRYRGKALQSFQNIRDLGKIVCDPNAVARLAETRSLSDATISSDYLVEERVKRTLGKGDDFVQRIDQQSHLLNQEHLQELETIAERLSGLLQRRGQAPLTPSNQPRSPLNTLTRARFSSITLVRYRGLHDLHFPDLRRVNLLVGTNNTGKTSVLEAIYILSRLNDDRALVETIERRARIQPGQAPQRWLVDQLPTKAEISGHFDDLDDLDNEARLKIWTRKDPDDLPGDQSAYLKSLHSEARYAGQVQTTLTIFQEKRPRRTRFTGNHWLCRSVFSSPFVADGMNTLQQHNKESYEHKVKNKVLAFIREHLDPGIEDIQLLEAFRHFGAHSVTHQKFTEAVDLTSFGQGLRRVYEIGLAFATARNGVFLIDEIENGLHVSLLPKFVQLIADFAKQFKVQVFITTHSKDTIDAFAENIEPEQLASYILVPQDDSITCKRVDGSQLLRMIKSMDIDLRGVQ